MTGKAELRLIRKFTKNKPFVLASVLENLLKERRAIIINKRARKTDEELDAAIRASEIQKCKKVLYEMGDL